MSTFKETARRSYNTEVRQPWNPLIKACLDAVDRHISLYLRTGEIKHLKQAQTLREYVSGLKEWIKTEENQGKSNQKEKEQ